MTAEKEDELLPCKALTVAHCDVTRHLTRLRSNQAPVFYGLPICLSIYDPGRPCDK